MEYETSHNPVPTAQSSGIVGSLTNRKHSSLSPSIHQEDSMKYPRDGHTV